MFSEVIFPIIDAFVPVYPELPLLYMVNHPVKAHVKGLAALLVYAHIEESFSGCVCLSLKKWGLVCDPFRLRL